MFSSSTLTFSIGSGERKRCSNMAPVRRLRSFAWMKARRLPGVRCSTLNTECKSLLCLMIMPGRSWVAGIDIARLHLLHSARNSGQRGRSGVPDWPAFGQLEWRSPGLPPHVGLTPHFTQVERIVGTGPAGELVVDNLSPKESPGFQLPITNHKLPIQHSGLE